ncbi:acid phosphatase det1, partial [Cladochytrium tenue]
SGGTDDDDDDDAMQVDDPSDGKRRKSSQDEPEPPPPTPPQKREEGVPQDLFSTFFTATHEVQVTFGTEQLFKDFCLFTNDRRFVVLASAVPNFSPLRLKYLHSLTCFPSLDDVTFWLVNLEDGVICDRIVFTQDYIVLSNHSGVQLYDDILAVTSVQNQSIHFVHIRPSGSFLMGRTVGWHTDDVDEMPIAQLRENEFQHLQATGGVTPLPSDPTALAPYPTRTNLDTDDGSSPPEPARDDVPYSGFKQRFLSFLYRKAMASEKMRTVRHYYLSFSQFASLVMWRMQFLDDNHILVKMGVLENVVNRGEPSSSQTCFFVLFSLETSAVLEVYENSSEELLELFETWPQFRGHAAGDAQTYSTFACNNEFARDAFHRQMYSIRKARNGGGRLFGDLPIKFWCRNTNQLRFRLDPNPVPPPGVRTTAYRPMQKRFANFLFHPHLPFVLSVLLVPSQPPVVTIHTRFR